jgi:uncharacterized protein (TIGR03437 family)
VSLRHGSVVSTMVRALRYLAGFSLSLLTFLTVLQAQQDRIPSRIGSGRTVVLPGRVHAQARPENDLGRVESSFTLPAITLLLKPSDSQQADLKQLLQEQQDPTSANFHNWLIPEQYANRFGASVNDVNKIVGWLQSQGFTVADVARGRTWISFTGTAAQTQGAFGTEIHRYQVNGQTHFANSNNPSIPAELANVVAGIRGLSDFHPQPRLRKETLPVNPQMTTAAGNHHIVPDDFATIYNVAPLFQAGVDGTGQNLVVVGQTDINTSDIQAFRSKFNLPAINLQRVLVPGQGNPGISQGDLQEADLDIEWASAVARNATIVYVYSNDVWQSAMYAVDHNLGTVLTMSYGTCEPSDIVDLSTFQSVAQQANAQGMTWFAASGDAGATDCEDPNAMIAQNGFAIDVPAALPEVTGMGGTILADQGGAYWSSTNTANSASALSYIPEQAWNDTPLGGGLAATGGGRSLFFPRPSWQTGPGVPNDTARHVPDLAVSTSADHDGYYVYTGGGSAYFGGTSVAAPTMAGIVALLNQYLVSTGAQKQAGLGNINPALYRLAQTTSGVFHDVVTGDNASPCVVGSPDCTTGSIGRTAGPGYDEVTGLGSVDAFNLLHQWSSQPARNSAVVPSIDQNPVFQQGSSWTFQITLSEEAGIGTTLTDFTIDGTSYAPQIASLFGGAAIAPSGSISAHVSLQNVAAPKTVTMTFSGVDASGRTWTTQMAVAFNGPQVAASVGGISNAASGQQVYAPGMILSVYGTQLGSFAQSAGTIPLPQYLAGFEGLINGVSAPLYYVSPGQVNIQIPYETQPGPATLVVGTPYQNVTYRFTVTSAAPGIFTFVNGTINPFPSGARGQTVTLFVTGEGQVSPSVPTGDTPSPNTALSLLPKPRQAVTVTVGGVPATVQFIGIPSGLVGVTQINYTIPSNAPTGAQPVVVTVGTAASQPATITVQ